MKILITYYSKTGNTEKIAKSIGEGLQNEEVDLKPIKDVEASALKNYDLIFLGSGIYASRVDKSLSQLVNTTDELPKKFVFFCTHASLNMYQDGFKLVKRKLAKVGSEIIGVFDCMGDNIGLPETTRNAMLNGFPPEKRKEAEQHQKRLKGKPNDEDLKNAKEFGQEVIKKF